MMKKIMKNDIEKYMAAYLKEIEDAGLRVIRAVLDAPERALCRRQKQHGGFFSCDVCVANPISLTNERNKGSKLLTCVFMIYELMMIR